MLTKDQIKECADVLWIAEKEKMPSEPLTQRFLDISLDSAYAIQKYNMDRMIQIGAKVSGYKIGLTSFKVQQQLGVYQPDYGVLFAEKELLQGFTYPMQLWIQPKIEAELAFVLKHDLASEPLGIADMLSAVDFVVPALEIVDSRIYNWNISIADTIADNASSANYILGNKVFRLDQLEITQFNAKLFANGELKSEGTGRDCLGSPLNSLLWLAKNMIKLNNPLRAGHVVLSGALGPMYTMKGKETIEAKFDTFEKLILHLD